MGVVNVEEREAKEETKVNAVDEVEKVVEKVEMDLEVADWVKVNVVVYLVEPEDMKEDEEGVV